MLRSWGRSSSLFDDQSEAIENRFNVSLDGIPYDAKFVFETVGYNLEGSEIGAAFGLEQLKKLSSNIKVRQINFFEQTEFFKKHEEFFACPEMLGTVSTAWLAYPILIKSSAPFSRRDFQIFLEKNNIQTRVVFTGNVTRQPMCKGKNFKIHPEGYKNADNIMERGVLLPVHHGLTKPMLDHLWATIEEFLKNHT